MKILISLLLMNFAVNATINAQFSISINSSQPKSCVDSVVQFTAAATVGGIPVSDVEFTWSFGDGTPDQSGIDLDTLEHTFTKGGGYIIKLNAKKDADADYLLYKYEIALTPNYSGTKSDREEPICLGQQIFLTGKIVDSTWTYEIPDENTEENAKLISDQQVYTSEFDYRIFTKSQVIATAIDIDSVGINLEHTNLSQVKIELICPGDTLILKDFGGPDKFFGEPIDDDNSNEVGVGYDYFWTNSPDNNFTMNASAPTGNSLPAGSYQPEQSFDNLAGCPMNGVWEIKLTDNQVNDKGYVFSSQLKFEESLLPVDWEYKHTYSFPEWVGSGVTTTSGSGLATAIPEDRGNWRYTYKLRDNFGCWQDTSLINRVEGVSFTAGPETEGPFDLTVDFANTTSWATGYLWDFGDETGMESIEKPNHVYKKDGVFKALLTASTDDGCSDTASILITVTIPESNPIEVPNAFSPYQDSPNAKFIIKVGTGIKSFDCWIYSRWGKKVAEFHSIEEAAAGWDGHYNGGQEASPGVYYYVIKAVGFDGKLYEPKGFIQLFRY